MAKTRDFSKFHIAMFPWFAFGHMNPFLHLANELAKRGHQISFLLPKKALLQLESANLYPDLITFHVVAVPPVDGLPPGTETASEIHLSSTGHLVTAMDLTRDQVEQLLTQLKPNFVFYDFAYWVPELAPKIGFKSVVYTVVSAASIAIALVPARNVPEDRPLTDADVAEPPPGYPSSTVVLRRHEARSLTFITKQFGSGKTFYSRTTTAMKECDAISFRTCREMEGQFCKYVGTQYNKPVLLTGPVLPALEKSPLEGWWAEWLARFRPGSVVFCAFGSQWILEKRQFQEMVLGFELTGYPFLVAVKPPVGVAKVEEALPEGFEERVKSRGLVYGEWVPQPELLSHESVGCFVTHCGFGSMWESLMSDKQIVLVPQLGDQILNSRIMTEELKVAVEVDRDEDGWFSKEILSKAVNSVMEEDGEVGTLVRRNHARWRETLATHGFMDSYVDRFLEELQEL